MSGHTPGPWNVGVTPEMHVWAAGTPRIAVVPFRDVSINEQKANAQLIAAAPALLEALRGLDSMFDNDSPLLTAYAKEIDQARAAIAAAEGRAE